MLIILFSFCTYILSNDPFIDQIRPEASFMLNSFVDLTYEDHNKYIIYTEKHKVQDPARFTFLSFPIRFLAFDADSSNSFSSIVLYFETDDDVLGKFEKEFGVPISEFTVRGDFEEISKEYISHAWKKKNYVMLMSAVPSLDKKLVRVWIKRVNS